MLQFIDEDFLRYLLKAYSISTLSKYLFTILVAAYVVTVIGVPVYFHYCGGELEKIDYLTKSESCCEGEEQDTAENDCCEDEGLYLLNTPDLVIKDSEHFQTLKNYTQTAFITLPYFCSPVNLISLKKFSFINDPPVSVPDIISVTVLRI
jgi:hypothetical protein